MLMLGAVCSNEAADDERGGREDEETPGGSNHL